MTGRYDYLQPIVEEIITYSQEYPFDVDCTILMSKWKKSKSPIIKKFGGKLAIRSEKPIVVKLSKEQRSRKFQEFISTLDEHDALDQDFKNFLSINKDGFFDNRVILPYPSKHITAGSKILKSFKYFLPMPEMVRWAQDVASQYI